MSPRVLTRILYRKTDAELDAIASQAETVALSGIGSISALSQSTSFNADQAAVILEAVENVRAAREKDPNATAPDGEALGHSIRFQPVVPPQGYTWGP